MESTEAMSSLLSSWDIPEDVVRRFHDQKIPLQMTLFGYLVPPKGRLSKKHKFSTAEAIEGLIVQTHNAGDIEDVIKKQVDKAKSRNTTAQPYVLLPGSLSKYNALYIVIDETVVQFRDLCPYPKLIWSFTTKNDQNNIVYFFSQMNTKID